ncbi:MAG: hypothetical protein Q7R46_01105 [bacterium]|nr:hypothetical protein [bacterium]
MREGEPKIIEPYQVKPKLFGERAERVQKAEYDFIIEELRDILSGNFHKIQPAEQLEDKESFGDIDIICLPKGTINEFYFREILGLRLMEYSHNAHVHSTLIRLKSEKQIHVDFIQSKNETDFDRKYMYYSKGHVSSMIGMLAKKLNFKYGTEGFFKRFQDKKGNLHDILISENLREGLSVIGLDAKELNEIHKIDDIAKFISHSPLFDNKYFISENMNRRDRDSIKRNKTEDYLVQEIRKVNKTRLIADEDELFKKLFPAQFKHFVEESERINSETYKTGAINGEMIMKIFEIKPGPAVGKILKFIGDNYPNAEALSEDIIAAVKSKAL